MVLFTSFLGLKCFIFSLIHLIYFDRLQKPIEIALRDGKLSFNDLNKGYTCWWINLYSDYSRAGEKDDWKDPNLIVNLDVMVAFRAIV